MNARPFRPSYAIGLILVLVAGAGILLALAADPSGKGASPPQSYCPPVCGQIQHIVFGEEVDGVTKDVAG